MLLKQNINKNIHCSGAKVEIQLLRVNPILKLYIRDLPIVANIYLYFVYIFQLTLFQTFRTLTIQSRVGQLGVYLLESGNTKVTPRMEIDAVCRLSFISHKHDVNIQIQRLRPVKFFLLYPRVCVISLLSAKLSNFTPRLPQPKKQGVGGEFIGCLYVNYMRVIAD